MRLSFPAGLAVSLGLLCALTARADAVYDLNLSGGGSGTFSLSTLPSSTPGVVTTYYASGDKNNDGTDTIDSLSISVGGVAFGLAGSIEETYIQFQDGTLSAIQYGDSVGATGLQITGLGYGFIQIGYGQPPTTGNVSATLTSSNPTMTTTPEPSSFLLLGTGLASGLGILRRRVV